MQQKFPAAIYITSIDRERCHFILVSEDTASDTQGKKKLLSSSNIGLDSGNLATFGSSWREGVPAIVETDI